MTWHAGLSLGLELIKVVAWPVVVVVLGWRLRPVFLALLGGREVELEGFGIKAKVRGVEQQQSAGDNPVKTPALPAGAPLPTLNRPALTAIEQTIQTQLVGIQQTEREPQLIRALAAARLLSGHEFVYNRIFGSQIEGLKRLDEAGSVTVEQAREFFKPYAERFPQLYSTYPFESWLGFMINAALVRREGDRLFPTEYGHDFLVYLREARLTEAKPW